MPSEQITEEILITFLTGRYHIEDMKQTISLTLLASLLFAGCAMNRQYATTETTSTNGVVTVTTAKAWTLAIGDARQVIEKSRASAGKTSSVGMEGLEQETTATNAVNLVEKIAGAVTTAAVKAAKP